MFHFQGLTLSTVHAVSPTAVHCMFFGALCSHIVTVAQVTSVSSLNIYHLCHRSREKKNGIHIRMLFTPWNASCFPTEMLQIRANTYGLQLIVQFSHNMPQSSLLRNLSYAWHVKVKMFNITCLKRMRICNVRKCHNCNKQGL